MVKLIHVFNNSRKGARKESTAGGFYYEEETELGLKKRIVEFSEVEVVRKSPLIEPIVIKKNHYGYLETEAVPLDKAIAIARERGGDFISLSPLDGKTYILFRRMGELESIKAESVTNILIYRPVKKRRTIVPLSNGTEGLKEISLDDLEIICSIPIWENRRKIRLFKGIAQKLGGRYLVRDLPNEGKVRAYVVYKDKSGKNGQKDS